MSDSNSNLYMSEDYLFMKHNHRKPKKLVPTTEKNDRYWERRNKNNEAARKSRENKRRIDDSMKQRIAFLEQINMKLEKQNTVLKTENDLIKTTFQLPLDEIFLTMNTTGQLVGQRRDLVMSEFTHTMNDSSIGSSLDSYTDTQDSMPDSIPDSSTKCVSRMLIQHGETTAELEQRVSPSSDSPSEDLYSSRVTIDEGHIPVKKRRNKLFSDFSSAEYSTKFSENGYSTDISSSESSSGDTQCQPERQRLHYYAEQNSHHQGLPAVGFHISTNQGAFTNSVPNAQVLERHASHHQGNEYSETSQQTQTSLTDCNSSAVECRSMYQSGNQVTPVRVPNSAFLLHLLTPDQKNSQQQTVYSGISNTPAQQLTSPAQQSNQHVVASSHYEARNLNMSIPMKETHEQVAISKDRTAEEQHSQTHADITNHGDDFVREKVKFLEDELQKVKQYLQHSID